ncbi:MAG: flagellar biosynthesis protein FlhF [Spirochaetota bacterium]
MQYFTEQAPSHREAIDQVKSKYGEQAQILSHRTVRTGGILGFFSRELVEVSGYLKARIEPPRPNNVGNLEEEKRKILNLTRPAGSTGGAEATGVDPRAGEKALEKVLSEIRELKTSIESSREAPAFDDENDSIARIDELLAQNDFSESYRRDIVARLRRDFTLEALEDWDAVQDGVLDWIGDSFEVWRGAEGPKPRILALVGPTGVGKTTTIAKLAAIYTVGIGGEKPRSVRMITIDNYRIGARQQIETYGNIMGVPVSCVETAEDLRKTLDLHSDADLILVDTIGKSPRDAVKLAEVQRLVQACGPRAEVHLALAATTKTSDMLEILRQFEPFAYRAVVLTKLDETDRIGNAISVLAEKRKALSYMTTGQKVPQDIERASQPRLLMRLEGFKPDRRRLEERYAPSPNEGRPNPARAGVRALGGA